MTIISHPSPNFDHRGDAPVDMLVLHYTGMPTGKAALERLCDPAAKVSAHYLIEEDGRVFQLVDEDRRAWHAGVACWRGQRDVNARSIGIELVNPGHEWGYREFQKSQLDALSMLCRDILTRHPIPARNVVGHSDVAPERKQDPGERFPWAWLAGQGVGLWPDKAAGSLAKSDPVAMLAEFGYNPDAWPEMLMIAFQRHFRPESITGQWDADCQARLNALMHRCELCL